MADEASLLQQIAWVGTAIGAIFAAIALAFNAKANRANTKVQAAEFWLDLRKMFLAHNEVHMKLQKGGAWYQSDEEPSDPQELATVIPYLSLFEQNQYLIDQGLLDIETIHRTIIPYRVRLLLQNGPIKRDLLHEGRKDKTTPNFHTFKRLVKNLDSVIDDCEYLKLYNNPKGGPERALIDSGECEPEETADSLEEKPREAHRSH